MRSLQGKRVLVTGAASGIGKAMAHAMGTHGATVLLADLNAEACRTVAGEFAAAGITAHPFTCDVTDADSVRALREQVMAQGGPIDVLVNNAGVVFGGAFADVPLERHMVTYRVNTLGVVAVTHAFMNDLIARPESHLVNVASASGYIGLPFGSTYASSKWAVIGFSESLELELELQGHTHVHVTTVCPSYVATGMFDGVRTPFTTELLTADVLAEQVVRAVLSDGHVVRTPWLVQWTPMLKGLMPHRWFNVMAGWLGVNTSMLHWRGRGGETVAHPTSGEPPRAAAGGR